MVDVVRTPDLVEIQTERLSCALHLATLTMELSDRDGRVALSGFLPRVQTENGIHLAERSAGDGYGEIRSRSGVATRVQARAQLDKGMGLVLALEFSDDWSGVILEVSVENHAAQPQTVRSIDPCWWNARAGGRLALPHKPGGTWFYRMGYQSDSRSEFLQLDLRRLQYIENLSESRVVFEQIVEPGNHRVQLRETRALAFRQRFQSVLRRLDQTRRMRKARVFGLQRLPFVGSEIERPEFARLPFELFAFGGECRGIGFECGALLAQPPPFAKQLGC